LRNKGNGKPPKTELNGFFALQIQSTVVANWKATNLMKNEGQDFGA
jgi:hypothetical protein